VRADKCKRQNAEEALLKRQESVSKVIGKRELPGKLLYGHDDGTEGFTAVYGKATPPCLGGV